MISVIIPTRNRAALLALALESIAAQTLPQEEFEVLVVDNGSSDNTADTIRSFSTQLENLRYLHEPRSGLHAGRHAGMLAARGEELVFADDDIEALPTWLAAMKDVFADPSVAMVGGNNLPQFAEAPPDWLMHLWQRPVTGGGHHLGALSILELPGDPRPFSPFLVWGCNFAIRRAILLAAGGFHPDAMPRDLIRFRGDGETHVSRYVAALRLKCMFHPEASVYHKVSRERMRIEYFRQRGFDQGISNSYTALRRDSWASPPSSPSIIRRASGLWRKLRTLADRNATATLALREFQAGLREGFAWHQQVYREDAALREWVHQPRYFEEAMDHA